MSESVLVAESVGRRYAVLRPHLDERQRRLLLGSEAAELGRGGIKTVAEATGAHPDTVARGVRELAGDPEPQVRVRATGGGRKKLSESDPGLLARLQPTSAEANRTLPDAGTLQPWSQMRAGSAYPSEFVTAANRRMRSRGRPLCRRREVLPLRLA